MSDLQHAETVPVTAGLQVSAMSLTSLYAVYPHPSWSWKFFFMEELKTRVEVKGQKDIFSVVFFSCSLRENIQPTTLKGPDQRVQIGITQLQIQNNQKLDFTHLNFTVFFPQRNSFIKIKITKNLLIFTATQTAKKHSLRMFLIPYLFLILCQRLV